CVAARVLASSHRRIASGELDDADDATEDHDQRGAVSHQLQIPSPLLDPPHLAQGRLVHGRLDLVLTFRDVDQAGLDDVGERRRLLAGGVADRLVQIAVEDVALQAAEELLLVHAGGEEEDLDAVDDHRDGEDQAQGDRVHAEAAALPVVRDRLEKGAHVCRSSAEKSSKAILPVRVPAILPPSYTPGPLAFAIWVPNGPESIGRFAGGVPAYREVLGRTNDVRWARVRRAWPGKSPFQKRATSRCPLWNRSKRRK